jgi:hypothetical protein
VYKGVWRGLPVALKTTVFVSAALHMLPPGSCDVSKDGVGRPGRLQHDWPFDHAIMEAAIAASVGHRNIVTTYHYDIKPIAELTRDRPLSGPMDRLEGSQTPPSTAGLQVVDQTQCCVDDESHANYQRAARSGAREFKLYLIQVRSVALGWKVWPTQYSAGTGLVQH